MKKYISFLASASLFPLVANAQSNITSVQQIIDLLNTILYWVSSAFWIMAGIFTLYAGFLYMTAAGSDQRVEKAKKQLLYAIIAIMIGLMGPGLSVLINNFLAGN